MDLAYFHQKLFGRVKTYTGRRNQATAPKYEFAPYYEVIGMSQTPRKCYVHPLEPATYWELNGQDKSYRRAVCQGCAS